MLDVKGREGYGMLHGDIRKVHLIIVVAIGPDLIGDAFE